MSTIYILLFAFVFNKFVLGTLQKDITKSVEYKIGQELSQLVEPSEKVFLSGSSLFWLNAFFDIQQVRGGNDRVSVDSNWRQVAWEIREGTDPQKSIKWLKELKIDWLVAHTLDSEEYYHDFKHPEKFEKIKEFKKVYDNDGDRIYKVNF